VRYYVFASFVIGRSIDLMPLMHNPEVQKLYRFFKPALKQVNQSWEAVQRCVRSTQPHRK
jgi:hypothetical protein